MTEREVDAVCDGYVCGLLTYEQLDMALDMVFAGLLNYDSAKRFGRAFANLWWTQVTTRPVICEWGTGREIPR